MPAPERRADSRVEHPPLILSMEGRRYESSDWSMSGFCLREYFRDLRPGERIRGLVSLAPAEPSGHLEAEVVRFGDNAHHPEALGAGQGPQLRAQGDHPRGTTVGR